MPRHLGVLFAVGLFALCPSCSSTSPSAGDCEAGTCECTGADCPGTIPGAGGSTGTGGAGQGGAQPTAKATCTATECCWDDCYRKSIVGQPRCWPTKLTICGGVLPAWFAEKQCVVSHEEESSNGTVIYILMMCPVVSSDGTRMLGAEINYNKCPTAADPLPALTADFATKCAASTGTGGAGGGATCGGGDVACGSGSPATAVATCDTGNCSSGTCTNGKMSFTPCPSAKPACEEGTCKECIGSGRYCDGDTLRQCGSGASVANCLNRSSGSSSYCSCYESGGTANCYYGNSVCN